jgi:hypothetical protein
MTINEINAAIISGSFTNDELTSIVDAVKFARSRVAQQTKNAITLGTQVRFTDPRNGRVHSTRDLPDDTRDSYVASS